MLSVLLLLGVTFTHGLKSQTLLRNKMAKNYAEAEADSNIAHSCQFSINRIKAGPADYKTILGSGVKYTDTSFPANSEMIRWADKPRPSGYSLASLATTCTYGRIGEKFSSPQLFGSGGASPFDIY